MLFLPTCWEQAPAPIVAFERMLLSAACEESCRNNIKSFLTCRSKCLIRRPPCIKPPFGSFRAPPRAAPRHPVRARATGGRAKRGLYHNYHNDNNDDDKMIIGIIITIIISMRVTCIILYTMI